MGRRAILGDYGRAIPHTEHKIPDSDLLTGGQYGRHRGVGRARVMVNFQQRLIDRYLFSNGKPGYYQPVADKQWEEQSDPKTITRPTKGQRARGMDDIAAQAHAGDFTPQPIDSDSPVDPPGDEAESPPEDKAKMILGHARAKSLILKGQLDELKILEARGVLANRQTLAREVISAAQITRDRVMGVSSFIVDSLYGAAHMDGKTAGERKHEMVRLLDAAEEDALVGLCEDEISRINEQ